MIPREQSLPLSYVQPCSFHTRGSGCVFPSLRVFISDMAPGRTGYLEGRWASVTQRYTNLRELQSGGPTCKLFGYKQRWLPPLTPPSHSLPRCSQNTLSRPLLWISSPDILSACLNICLHVTRLMLMHFCSNSTQFSSWYMMEPRTC